MADPAILTLAEAAAAVRDGEVTSADLTDGALARADDYDGLLGVYLARFDDSAREAAAQADAEIAAGRVTGPLHGVPIGVKDLLATREGPTTAQSLMIDPDWGKDDAVAVARLRAAGAVITGKTTLLELAYGTHDPAHGLPLPRNPWDVRTWPGGSSSGSGAGVAAGMMFGAVGTDTGGSVRVPAAMCGITGLKPTHGLVPLDGCVPLSWTQDHIGPLAPSAEDCRIMLEVMAATSLDKRRHPDHRFPDLSGTRVGVDRLERITAGAQDPAVEPLLEDALAVLVSLGAELVDLELPLYREVLDASFLTVAAERLAYHRSNLPDRWNDYGRNARLGMARAAYYSAADYVQAQRVRHLAQTQVARLFVDVDLIVTPMSSAATPLVGDVDAFMATWKQLVHAPYWDAVGNPALSLPMGLDETDGTGMPLALQLIGRPYEDAEVLRVGEAFQGVTDWHRQRPDLERIRDTP